MTDSLTMPRGLQIAAAWLDQIRAATGQEPDQTAIDRIIAECHRNRPCRDCGAEIGQPHEHGCDVERCQTTGEQWIACGGQSDWHPCDCEDGNGYDADGYTAHTCEQTEHDCGSQVWDGLWHGIAEAVEYGWYGYFDDTGREYPYGGPWIQCGPEHPKASPDLSRMHQLCTWDPSLRRWLRTDLWRKQYLAGMAAR